MGRKKDCICIHFWEPFLSPLRAQVLWTETRKNHVAPGFLQLRDLLKCPAAGSGHNTHSKEAAQRITSIFVQHD